MLAAIAAAPVPVFVCGLVTVKAVKFAKSHGFQLRIDILDM
jgi:hypothetical protein